MKIISIAIIIAIVILIFRQKPELLSNIKGIKITNAGKWLSLVRNGTPAWLVGWFSWGGFVTILIFLTVGYFGYNGYQYFFHGEENQIRIARAEIGDAGMVFFTVPAIPPEFENKIIFEKAWGFRFNEAAAEINFPQATLLQFTEDTGATLARFFSGKFLGNEEVQPIEKFRGSIKGGQPGLPRNVALIRSGSELQFSNRNEHLLYVPKGAILGDFPHLRYRLKKIKL